MEKFIFYFGTYLKKKNWKTDKNKQSLNYIIEHGRLECTSF